MPRRHPSNVREIATNKPTGGSVAFTLPDSALLPFRSFDSALATGDTVPVHASNGSVWQDFIGTFTAGSPDTLAQTTFLDSSTGAFVDWSTGGGVTLEVAWVGKLGDEYEATKAALDTKQPLNANLTAEASLTGAADRVSYYTGVGAKALATFTSAARTLVAAIDAAAQRVVLGLGSIATQAANAIAITGGAISGTTIGATRGFSWAARTSAADNTWLSVAYGNVLFVAVANSGTGNRVMTSPDGINWTIRTSAADNNWYSVTYGNGLFVAVAISGTGNRVMTSPDGINWTIRTSAADNQWLNVTYGNGMFVAVANTGTGNRVMTSPDGINWTIRTSAADNGWYGVTYGNGLFVAVSDTGTGNRVMTSTDGITWTIRTSAADNSWRSVAYGNGLFVAVAASGVGNRVMTSPDGINWTIRTSAADNAWYGLTYGNGLFVAVAANGTGNRVMTSPDGINWTIRTSAADNGWYDVTYGNGLFVAVANTGTGNRVMTSGIQEERATQYRVFGPAQYNRTASRALNTGYTNTHPRSIIVNATVRCAISVDAGVATAQGKAGGAIATGVVGVQAGLLGEDNTFQLSFLVAPGQAYQIDSVATNGTVTLGDWFETTF